MAEPGLDHGDGGLRETSPMVHLQVQPSASPVEDQHLPPGLAPLAPDPDYVLLDRDVRLSSMLRHEVAYLPREVRLVGAEPSDLVEEWEELLDLLPIDLKGGVTLKESMSRLVQSTMKCSLRKSL